MNVKHCILSVGLVLGLGTCQFALAQAPAGAPAGSTAVCKDGTYISTAKRSGACRGHKGVQTWFAAKTSTSTAATKPPAVTSAPLAVPAAQAPRATTTPARSSRTSTVAQAPGGGPGLVWVNTSSNVYHCSGSAYYGKTKVGKYMTEAQAKAAGVHPDHGKACSQ